MENILTTVVKIFIEFTSETRFARYQSKFSLISGIKKKILLRLKKI